MWSMTVMFLTMWEYTRDVEEDYRRFRPDKLPPEYQDIRYEEGVERAVCDYISGMTDKYAVERFGEAFIPKSWSVK